VTIQRIAVVLNGKAGALLGRAEASRILQTELDAAGLVAAFIPAEGSLPDRIARAVAAGADAVVVAGGDGTIACAAQHMAGGSVPLGILPFGTMNLFAKDLHLPVGDVAAALRVIAAGHTRRVDVGDVNGRVFLCGSMLGLPVRLGRYREGSRGSATLWLRMARAALRLLVRGAPIKGQIEFAGKARRLKASSMTVTVNMIDAESGLSFARRHLDRGELGIYLIQAAGVLAYLGLAFNLITGRWRHDRGVRVYRSESADLTSQARGVKVMNDGEIVLIPPPLHYRVRKQDLLVLAPG
jgi:diacylglycerol kinase family enzyme